MILLFVIIAIFISVMYFCFFKLTWLKALFVPTASFLLVNIVYMLFWAAVGLFADTSKPIKKQSRLCRSGCIGISSLALGYCGVHTKVYGLEKLPEKGRFLIVCNHRSLFDPLILVKYLKDFNLAFVGKPEALSLPVVGKVGYAAGCLPIDRENDREAVKTILTAADYLKKDFCSMAIFPEGTRNKTEETVLPFHAGSFKIAQKAGVPVVIAALCGTGNISKNMFRRRTDTELHVLDVIPADRVKKAKTRELAECSRNLIKNDIIEADRKDRGYRQ